MFLMKQPIVLSLFPTRTVLALDLLSVTIWTFGVLKLLVIDIDRYLVEVIAPDHILVLDFRLIGVAFVVLCAIMTLGRKKFFATMTYVACFPVLLVVWKIPILLVKLGSWVWRIAFLNVVLSAFTDIRYRLAYFVIYSISFVATVVVYNKTAAFIGMVGILLCVTVSFVRAFWGAFKAPRVLALYRKVFDWVQKEDISSGATTKFPTPLSALPADLSKDMVQSVQTSVFINRLCVVFSKRLQEYNKSEVHVVSGISSIASLTFLMFVSFSFLYRAASVIDPNSIEFLQASGAFDYAYIAFDNMFFGTNSSSRLASNLSQFLSMYQRALSTAVLAIFAAILLEIKRRRHTSEIDSAIEAAEKAAQRVESKIVAEYSYSSVDEAMDDLSKIESSLYAAVVKFMGSVKFR